MDYHDRDYSYSGRRHRGPSHGNNSRPICPRCNWHASSMAIVCQFCGIRLIPDRRRSRSPSRRNNNSYRDRYDNSQPTRGRDRRRRQVIESPRALPLPPRQPQPQPRARGRGRVRGRGRGHPAQTGSNLPTLSAQVSVAHHQERRPGNFWCNKCCQPDHWASENSLHSSEPNFGTDALLQKKLPEFHKIWQRQGVTEFSDQEWQEYMIREPSNNSELVHHLWRLVDSIVTGYRAWAPQRDALFQEITLSARHATLEMPLLKGDTGHTPWEYFAARANRNTLSFLGMLIGAIGKLFDKAVIKARRPVEDQSRPIRTTDRLQVLQSFARTTDPASTGAPNRTLVDTIISRLNEEYVKYEERMASFEQAWLPLLMTRGLLRAQYLSQEWKQLVSLPFTGMRIELRNEDTWLPMVYFPPVKALQEYRVVVPLTDVVMTNTALEAPAGTDLAAVDQDKAANLALPASPPPKLIDYSDDDAGDDAVLDADLEDPPLPPV